jgi:hypothetical protein
MAKLLVMKNVMTETLPIMMDVAQHAPFNQNMFVQEFHQTVSMFVEMEYLTIDRENFVIMGLFKQDKLKMDVRMIVLEKTMDGLATTPLAENQFANQFVEMA